MTTLTQGNTSLKAHIGYVSLLILFSCRLISGLFVFLSKEAERLFVGVRNRDFTVFYNYLWILKAMTI